MVSLRGQDTETWSQSRIWFLQHQVNKNCFQLHFYCKTLSYTMVGRNNWGYWLNQKFASSLYLFGVYMPLLDIACNIITTEERLTFFLEFFWNYMWFWYIELHWNLTWLVWQKGRRGENNHGMPEVVELL